MVEQIAVVHFDAPLATGDFDITDPSITETVNLALFIYSGTTALGTDADGCMLGMGACTPNGSDSGHQNASYCTHGDNASLNAPDYDTLRDTGDASSHCIVVVNQAFTIVSNAAFVSTMAGGVKINFNVASAAVKVTCILFAGFSAGAVGSFSGEGPTAELVGISPHFAPDVLALFGGGGTLNTAINDAQANLGFATRVQAAERSMFVNFDQVEPTDMDGIVSSDAMATGHQNQTRAVEYMDLDSWNSDGFTWRGDRVAGLPSPSAMYCALKAASSQVKIACAAMTVAGATGRQDFNPFGFTPDIVVGMLTPLTALDSYTSGALAGAAAFFVTGKYGSRAAAMHAENAKSGTGISFNNRNRQENVALLGYNHTGTVVQRATWAGPSGNGGFALNFSVASQAGYMVALGIQLAPTSLVAPRRPQGSARAKQRRSPQARAAFTRRARGTFLRLLQWWEVQRRGMFDRLHRRSLPPRAGVVIERFEGETRGDNAFAGSLKGADAGAGSQVGDTG